MNKDQGETDPLSVYRVVVGNHRRNRFNQCHIGAMSQEILPRLARKGAADDVGTIAPFHAQADALKAQLDSLKRISTYDSENLMYATIVDVLAQHADLSLFVAAIPWVAGWD